jgi:hypothetical protein
MAAAAAGDLCHPVRDAAVLAGQATKTRAARAKCAGRWTGSPRSGTSSGTARPSSPAGCCTTGAAAVTTGRCCGRPWKSTGPPWAPKASPPRSAPTPASHLHPPRLPRPMPTRLPDSAGGGMAPTLPALPPAAVRPGRPRPGPRPVSVPCTPPPTTEHTWVSGTTFRPRRTAGRPAPRRPRSARVAPRPHLGPESRLDALPATVIVQVCAPVPRSRNSCCSAWR